MIHLVHFYLKEEFKNAETRAGFEEALAKVCEIPIATRSNWGVPASVAERPVVDSSWDYNLVSYFDSVKDHDAYQEHDVHVAFINDNKHLWEKVLVIDSDLKG